MTTAVLNRARIQRIERRAQDPHMRRGGATTDRNDFTLNTNPPGAQARRPPFFQWRTSMVEKTNVVSIATPGFDLNKFRSKCAAVVQNRYWKVSELEIGYRGGHQ